MTKTWEDYEELKRLKPDLIARYDFLEYLGGGGFGRVFKLKDRALDRIVALKVLRLTEYDEDERKEVETRFQREAKAYAKCRHPNIVSIYDVNHDDSFPHFFMEYIEGKDLGAIIKNKGSLKWEEALRISEAVLTALYYLHKNDLVHRDLKPRNIMVDEKSKKIVIIDLGITKNLGISSKSKISAGTPFYMAPEQFDVEMGVTSKIDIYSFGVVLYEMLTGKLPFKGRNQAQIMNEHLFKEIPNIRIENPDLPAGIEEIIFKAMAKNPADRYQSAMDFLIALKNLKGVGYKVEIEKKKEILKKKKVKKRMVKEAIPIKYLIGIFITAVVIFVLIFDPSKIIYEDEYQDFLKMAKASVKTGEYEKARYYLENAMSIINTDETQTLSKEIARLEQEIKNGEKVYDRIKDQLDLQKYLEFKRKYPESSYLQDLQYRLKKMDNALPPEIYWESMQKNNKGYYEFTFVIGQEKNEHRMIYIPEKGYWIDKYEVSWLQFRKFLQVEKIRLPTSKNRQYIKEGDEFPAVVTYESAVRYCEKYGFKLPTGAEWEYAAGKGEFTYPWGNELPDANGVYRANFDSFEDGFEGTAPVFSFGKFSSPFGVVNMAGNAWEWVQGKNLKGGGFFSDKGDLAIGMRKPGKSGIEEGFRCIKQEK